MHKNTYVCTYTYIYILIYTYICKLRDEWDLQKQRPASSELAAE